jgi:hypothetical protein
MIYCDDLACRMRRATGGSLALPLRRASLAYHALDAGLRLLHSQVHLFIDAPGHAG